jgi:Zn-dependent protease
MNFLAGSFRIGRLFDIEIRVHMLFVIWIAFELLWRGAGTQYLAFIGLLFGIVLIHELGHCFGARSVGGDAHHILMWPLGGLAFAQAPMTPWAQFVTVACGPLVNLIFCIISGAYLVWYTGQFSLILLNPFYGIFLPPAGLGLLGFMLIFYQVNLLLLAFNLLPIYPLDGGQLFQCALWPFVGLHRAMEVACKVGIVGCIGLGIWALSGGGGSMLLLIAFFGAFMCWQRLQALKYGMVVDERITQAPVTRYRRRGGGFWSRLFGGRRRRSGTAANPNPGGWERKVQRERTLSEEVDRILDKVHREGIQSLSYTEQQTLERASRERQQREREFERQNRV